MPQKKARPDAAAAKAKEEIASKAKAAVKDKKCLNGLLDLLSNLDLDEEPTKLDIAKAVASVRCLTEAFQHFHASGDLDQAEEEDGNAKDATTEVSAWLKERHDSFWDSLGTLAATDVEDNLNEFALVGAFRLIRAIHKRREKVRLANEGENFTPPDQWKGVEVKKLRNYLLPALLSTKSCKAKQIKRFKQYLDFVDVKQHVIQGLLKLLKQKVKENQISVHFVRNLLCMLECLSFSKLSKKQEEHLNTFLCKDEESGEGSTYAYDHEAVRKSFSELWELFLKQKLDVESYKRALLMLDDKVMPHLTRPLLLTDFLVNSYSIGGAIGILALGGVFNLMQKYNLEYPDFYAKLYGLFKADVLHAKWVFGDRLRTAAL